MSENFKQFDTASSFSLHIEQMAREKKMPYMDAVLQYCEQNFMEPQDIASLINKSLRDKIAVEMREQNLLPKQATLGDF